MLFNRNMILQVEEIKAGLAGRLLEAFLGHAPGRYQAYREGLRIGDWKAVEDAAHSLKSSAGQLGAERLLDVCASLEAKAEAADAEGVSGLTGEFDTIYAGTLAALEEERRVWINGKR
ncbi:MAG: Multi-sensor hybrid histidine kinase [Fibrobacteres bacterium]|nr:Multi-sensor hybrid histidine kinase [Fibrobacterota bacterium]